MKKTPLRLSVQLAPHTVSDDVADRLAVGKDHATGPREPRCPRRPEVPGERVCRHEPAAMLVWPATVPQVARELALIEAVGKK